MLHLRGPVLARLDPAGEVEVRDQAWVLDGRITFQRPASTDGAEVLANTSLVGDGYAVALAIDPNRAHRAEISTLEQQARAAGAGLWGACGGPGVAVDAVTGR